MPSIPLPQPNNPDIYHFGFDKNLYRDPPNVGEILSGENIDSRFGVYESDISIGGDRYYVSGNMGMMVDGKLEPYRVVVSPKDNIQTAIDKLGIRGGEVFMTTGAYSVDYDIIVPSNVSLTGQGITNTIINFGGSAKQIKAQGSGQYSTGTVTINQGSDTVTGNGTSWASNLTTNHMIKLGGIWYSISTVTNDTSLKLVTDYLEEDLAAASYDSAILTKHVTLSNFTVIASLIDGVYFNYTYNANFYSMILWSNLGSGLSVNNSAYPGTNILFSQENGDNGIELVNCDHAILLNTGGYSNAGDGLNCSNVTTSVFNQVEFMDNVHGVYLNNVKGRMFEVGVFYCSAEGIEMLNSSFTDIIAGVSVGNGSDGIKLTSDNEQCHISSNGLKDNGGYGINIAAASNENIILGGNTFDNNTSGDYNNQGTNVTILGEGNPTGTITAYGGSSAPTGYLLCDGSAVSRTTYAALFAVTSTKYGVGDGSTTFNIPNLKGKLPVGLDSSIADFDDRGKTGGEKTHALTTAELAAHTHSTVLGKADIEVGSGANSGAISNGSLATGSAGSGTAHENMPPYVIINYIIKT